MTNSSGKIILPKRPRHIKLTFCVVVFCIFSLALILWGLFTENSLLGIQQHELTVMENNKKGKAPLSKERVVFVMEEGEIELAFYPTIAPVTSRHIYNLARLGLYKSVNFFRVEPNFVAQTKEVYQRRLHLSLNQRRLAYRRMPPEYHWQTKKERTNKFVQHLKGSLSLARHDDPGSGQSSFSILLKAQPALNGDYTLFGEVIRGIEIVLKWQDKKAEWHGMFRMPIDRIEILNTYTYIDTHDDAEVDDNQNKTLNGHSGDIGIRIPIQNTS